MSGPIKPSKGLKVAVVGGGICGLTCAIALQRVGVSVEVFEAAARFGEIGAGIGVGANAARVLEKIGVFGEVLAKTMERGLNMETYRFQSGMEGHEVLYEYLVSSEDRGVAAHRAAFIDALVKFVDPNTTHFNKRCTSVDVSPTDPSLSIVRFADGTVYEADIVIGADGIKSNVRTVVEGKPGPHLAFSNTRCYRGLIPMSAIKAAGVKTDFSTAQLVMFLGKGGHMVLVPVKNSSLLNIVAFVADYTSAIGSASISPEESWMRIVPQEEMLKEFEGWGSDAIGILKCIPEPSRWSIHVVHPSLESYVKGRVALIGDAAHGMLPHLGAGAGQGIEDAYLLARLLGHPQTTPANVEAILTAYDRFRRPRAQMVWDASYRTGRIYDGCGPHGLSPAGVQEDVHDIWHPVTRHDVEDDIELAITWLKDNDIFT